MATKKKNKLSDVLKSRIERWREFAKTGEDPAGFWIVRTESPQWPDSQLGTLLFWRDIVETEDWTWNVTPPTVATTENSLVNKEDDRSEKQKWIDAAAEVNRKRIARKRSECSAKWGTFDPVSETCSFGLWGRPDAWPREFVNQAWESLEQQQAKVNLREAKEVWQEQLDESERIFEDELKRKTDRIIAEWKRTMDTLTRSLALRGWLRGSQWEAKTATQQQLTNDLISTAERKADLERSLRDQKIKWATGDAVQSIQDDIDALNKELVEKAKKNIETQLEISAEIWTENLQSVLDLLDASWSDTSWVDQAKSQQAGYLVNADWGMFTDSNWNPIKIKQSNWNLTTAQIDEFGSALAAWKAKFSDLKLEWDDLADVIASMNSKLWTQSWLSTNRLKAQRILKDLWIWSDETSINTVTNLLKVNSEQAVRDMIATDEFKQAAFVAWNQKLFDDLKKDSANFKDIKNRFNSMDQIWKDFQNDPPANRWAMEAALVIMFNKMLDPWSVVREWEFDRTSEQQSAIQTWLGWLQRLESWWAWISNETFWDIINIVDVLMWAAEDSVWDIKTTYKWTAKDLWADPEFVERFFSVWFGEDSTWAILPEDEQFEIDSIFTEDEDWGWTFETSSWFKFKTGWGAVEGEEISGTVFWPSTIS